MLKIRCPSIEDLNRAREVFLENEPRDLFYRVATELIKLAIEEKTTLSLPEALAVLLQTWNRAYYQFRPFDNEHFIKIDQLVEEYAKAIAVFRKRSILSLSESDEYKISEIFGAFEKVLGPVGATKSLHLLAPQFFPLWDRTIAEAYSVAMGPVSTNAGRYCNFMKIAKTQCERLQLKLPKMTNLLKAIDEYNYCHYTKGWI